MPVEQVDGGFRWGKTGKVYKRRIDAVKQGQAIMAQGADRGLAKGGLWDNIHAKRKRIAAGSGETMRKKGATGAPTDKAFKKAQGLNKGGLCGASNPPSKKRV